MRLEIGRCNPNGLWYNAEMHCERAIIYSKDGKPHSYSLILDGMNNCPDHPNGVKLRETSFKEAWETFAAVRKHWRPDGTAKE